MAVLHQHRSPLQLDNNPPLPPLKNFSLAAPTSIESPTLPLPPSTYSHSSSSTQTQNTTAMCFFDQQIYVCGDHKWGRFRAHCNKEYRMGETCGMKLIYDVTKAPGKCSLCKKYEVIWRKIMQATERVQRWEMEGINPASTEKERMNIAVWQKELREIEYQKQTRMRTV